MKDKIKNWLDNHETVYGVALLCAGLCSVAFCGTYLGTKSRQPDNTIIVSLYGDDVVKKLYGE